MPPKAWGELLACPGCQSPLHEDAATLRCGSCAESYPLLDGIPWLLPDPVASLGEWKSRLKALMGRLEADAEELKAELKDASTLPSLTAKRLRKFLQATVEHRKAIAELLTPLALADGGSYELNQAMRIKLPQSQSLTGYYSNIHRDWAWETGENKAGLDVLDKVLADEAPLGLTLVLGAGACRLAYDLHRTRRPELTIATDINPLMLFAAKRILKGRGVKLYEFPLAPLDLESQAVLRKCSAPASSVPGLELVFADALRAPFAAGSFDTVVTPWLVDIVPAELGTLAKAVNALLKPGGRWLEFGSLAFNHARHAWNYSLEETLERVQEAGFAPPSVVRERIPYMHSPASCHARLETVTAFTAVKEQPVSCDAPYRYLPEWLMRSDVAIPRSQAFESFQVMHTILAQAVSLIDGRRTLGELAQAFGAQHGLSPAEAEAAIRGFLIKHHEESLLGHRH